MEGFELVGSTPVRFEFTVEGEQIANLLSMTIRQHAGLGRHLVAKPEHCNLAGGRPLHTSLNLIVLT